MCKHVFLRLGKERPFTGLCESAVKSTGLWPQSALWIPTTQRNTEQWRCVFNKINKSYYCYSGFVAQSPCMVTPIRSSM